MQKKLVTLREWHTNTFDEKSRPHYQTVLLWAKKGLISNCEKVGRRYFINIANGTDITVAGTNGIDMPAALRALQDNSITATC